MRALILVCVDLFGYLLVVSSDLLLVGADPVAGAGYNDPGDHYNIIGTHLWLVSFNRKDRLGGLFLEASCEMQFLAQGTYLAVMSGYLVSLLAAVSKILVHFFAEITQIWGI